MIELNLVSVAVAAVVAFIFGWVWYSFLFAKPWMRYMGMDPSNMPEDAKKGMAGKMAIQLVSVVIMAFILGHFLKNFGLVSDLTASLSFAFWVWLGFFATTDIGVVLWEKKSWNLYLINTAHHLLVLLLIALTFNLMA